MYISNEAYEKLHAFLEDYDDGIVRIAQLSIGGGWASKFILGVTLDESYDENDDEIIQINEITIVIDKTLYKTLNDIKINFDEEKGITVSHRNSK